MMKRHSSSSIHAAPHWSWHVLAALAVLLLSVAALLYQLTPAHVPFGQAQRHVLAALCAVLGVGCLIPWSLRRILSRDWRAALIRQPRQPRPPVHDIIPVVPLPFQM